MTDEESLQAADPETPQAVLADLAYRHPELRAVIAANPNAYGGLRAWIAEAGARVAEVPEPTVSAAPVTSAPEGSSPLGNHGVAVGASVWSMKAIAVALAVALASAGSLVGGGFAVAGIRTAVTGLVSQAFGQAHSGQGAAGDNSQQAPGSGAAGGTEAAAGGSAATEKKTPRYIPTMLIMDASGSMVRKISSGGTRMQAARAAATTFVDGLGADAQVGLMVFGTTTGNKDSDRAAGCQDITTVVPVGKVDKATFNAAIAGIKESGFTPLGPSMKLAAQRLAGAGEARIVIVTDGVDTCAPPSACDVATQLHHDTPGLTIHTVGFAVDADEEAQAQLGCIAEAGGGEYADAGSAAQLAAKLRILSDPASVENAMSASGLKDLKLGMSLDQVKGTVSGVVVGKTIDQIVYVECPYASLQFKAGRLYSIQAKTQVSTADGLKIGDDLASAVTLYGAAVPATDSKGTYAIFPASRASDSGYRVYYQPSSSGALTGKIIRIVLCSCGPGGDGTSEISNWQFSFSGVGPLTLGMKWKDALAVVPDPRAEEDSDECGVLTMAGSGVGAQLGMYAFGRGSARKAYAFAVAGGGSVSDDRLPRTTKNIGIGSTGAQVRAAYQGLTIVKMDDRKYAIVTDVKGVSLILGLGNDRVNFIQLGTVHIPIEVACAF